MPKFNSEAINDRYYVGCILGKNVSKNLADIKIGPFRKVSRIELFKEIKN